MNFPKPHNDNDNDNNKGVIGVFKGKQKLGLLNIHKPSMNADKQICFELFSSDFIFVNERENLMKR